LGIAPSERRHVGLRVVAARRARLRSFRDRAVSAKEGPNGVKIVHPKNGEETWWPLFDDSGEALFPEPMAELDAIKKAMVSGLVFRRDHAHRKSRTPLPWITERKDLRYLRRVAKKIVTAAGLRGELSSFVTAGDIISVCLSDIFGIRTLLPHSVMAASPRELIATLPMPSCGPLGATGRRATCQLMQSGPASS
jgi:hypothetical protein